MTFPHPPLAILHRFAAKAFLPQSPDRLGLIQSGLVRTITWNRDSSMTTLSLWGQEDVVGLTLTQLCPYQMECLTAVVVVELSLGQATIPWRELL